MRNCPFHLENCQGCLLYLELEDFKGCSLEISTKGVDEAVNALRAFAQRIDKSKYREPVMSVLKKILK